MGWFSANYLSILGVAFLSILIFILLPSPPSSSSNNATRGTPLTIPGPILASRATNLNLDGLTLIPTIRLPPFKYSRKIPWVNQRLHLRIATTGSEIIFRKLRIASFEAKSTDAFREGVEAKVGEVEVDFSGSFSVTATVRLESLVSARVTGQTDTTTTSSQSTDTPLAPTRWAWRYVGSGRVTASITQAGARVLLRLVELNTKKEPSVELVESDVIVGNIDFLKVVGFGKYGGTIVTKFLPLLQGSWMVNYPTKLIANFFLKEIVEGKEMEEVIKGIMDLGMGHVDLDTYGGMVDEERKTELAIPVDENSLVPPAPLVLNSISSSTSSLSSHPASTASSLSRESIPAPKSTSFRLHAHLIGPTLLTSFPLPDFSPILYPPGGHRAALQSLNLLTDEFKLELSENELSSISFERASLAFDPPSVVVGKEGAGIGGGELMITVQSFRVVLLSHFKIHANTSSIVSWTTGLKKIGEKGSSSTVVTSRSLQLRFHLEPVLHSRDDDHRNLSPYQLTSSSISPFTTITPSFKLDTPALALGTELLNLMTSQLDQLIAKAASVIVQKFMKEDMRRRLQEVLDGAEEKLREVGIELPSEFRGSG